MFVLLRYLFGGVSVWLFTVIVGFLVCLVVYLILICWCYVCLFVMFVEC